MPYNPFSLEGKKILVTGASSGIGRAVAVECSKMGAEVLATGRDAQRVDQTLSMLQGEGHRGFLADFNRPDGAGELYEQLKSVCPIDGIVHCAGIIKTVPFGFTSADLVQEVMGVNFTAPTLLTSLLVKHKGLAKGASVVFVSSINGVFCAGAGSSIYSASKGALNGLVKTMALELAAKQIRVNSVNPGMIDTGLFDQSAIDQEQLDEDKKRYPLKRYGTPQEVAYAAVYLLSAASAWTTGSTIVLDGGYTLN